jgi:hypothetical protein
MEDGSFASPSSECRKQLTREAGVSIEPRVERGFASATLGRVEN